MGRRWGPLLGPACPVPLPTESIAPEWGFLLGFWGGKSPLSHDLPCPEAHSCCWAVGTGTFGGLGWAQLQGTRAGPLGGLSAWEPGAFFRFSSMPGVQARAPATSSTVQIPCPGCASILQPLVETSVFRCLSRWHSPL